MCWQNTTTQHPMQRMKTYITEESFEIGKFYLYSMRHIPIGLIYLMISSSSLSVCALFVLIDIYIYLIFAYPLRVAFAFYWYNSHDDDECMRCLNARFVHHIYFVRASFARFCPLPLPSTKCLLLRIMHGQAIERSRYEKLEKTIIFKKKK